MAATFRHTEEMLLLDFLKHKHTMTGYCFLMHLIEEANTRNNRCYYLACLLQRLSYN